MPTKVIKSDKDLFQQWCVEIPKGLENADRDLVSYLAVGSRGQKIDKERAVCYASLRGGYDKFDITCRPLNNPGVISLKDAQSFFQIMAQLEVVPPELFLWEDKSGIFLRIPPKAGRMFQVYCALTCYRWVDSHPPLVWEFLRIMEKETPKHPLQVLAYVISKHVSNTNHSFISTYPSGDRPGSRSNRDPLVGLAAKIYFDPKDPRGNSDQEEGRHVNSSIVELSKSITPVLGKKDTSPWGATLTRVVLKYTLESPEMFLHPGLYPLYERPNITSEEIEEILDPICADQE